MGTKYHVLTDEHAGQRTSVTVDDEQIWIVTDHTGRARQVRREHGKVVADPQIDERVALIFFEIPGYTTAPYEEGDEPVEEVVLTSDPFFAPKPERRPNRTERMLAELRAARTYKERATPPPATLAEAREQKADLEDETIGMGAQILELQAQLRQLQAQLQGGDPAAAASGVAANQVPTGGVHTLGDGTQVQMHDLAPAPTAQQVTGERQPEADDADARDADDDAEVVAASINSRGRGNKRKAADPLADIPTE